jgi:hypothetical protein
MLMGNSAGRMPGENKVVISSSPTGCQVGGAVRVRTVGTDPVVLS